MFVYPISYVDNIGLKTSVHANQLKFKWAFIQLHWKYLVIEIEMWALFPILSSE